MRIACLLLAAGEGKRFGACKQLALFDGKPLTAHALEPLARVFAENLYVVLGAHADNVQPIIAGSAHVINNAGWRNGIGSSIAYGVAEIEKRGMWDGIMIALADQPLLTSTDYLKLARRFDDNRVVAARYVERPGAPAIFPRKLFADLKQLDGDSGAKAILTRMNAEIVTISMEAAATDIDSMNDLKQIRFPGANIRA